MGFATDNIAKVGGWATREKIFRTSPHPENITDERFTINILLHEGRHFSDYKLFPKLQQGGLEYRAKLTELSQAKETLHKRLKNFLNTAKNDPAVPHALAEYQIIRKMSKEIFDVDYQGNIKSWIDTPVEKINAAATQILNRNTSWLKSNNPEEIETFLEIENFG